MRATDLGDDLPRGWHAARPERSGEEWVLAKVTNEIADSQFTIRTSAPGTKVCWQVTGVRHDAWAEAHPLEVEQDKSDAERGLYLAPAEHGQPEEKAIDRARKPKAPEPA